MSSNKCPVCGNQGIPAYHKEDVICPRCGSDLRVYKSLSDVADANLKSEKANKRSRLLMILLPMIVFVLCVIPTYHFYDRQSGLNDVISNNELEIINLRDSINFLTQQIQLKDAELNAKIESSTYSDYIIVHNDSPWRIVKKIYGIRGDWKELAKQIAIDNNIWDKDEQEWKQIHPGQVIKIYKH